MVIDPLFSVRISDSEWLRNAARSLLSVLGPVTADWFAVDWHSAEEEMAFDAVAANSTAGMSMAVDFPATTHRDLPVRMARSGGLTTVTASGLWTEHAHDFFAGIRRRDASVITLNRPDRGLVVGRLLRKRAPHPPGDRRLLAPVVRCVNLAWRARKYLALGSRDELAEAVFDPTGAVLHATSAAAERPSLLALRAAVIAREQGLRTAGASVAGTTIWSHLVEGRWSLVDDHEGCGRRYVLAVRNDAFTNAVKVVGD